MSKKDEQLRRKHTAISQCLHIISSLSMPVPTVLSGRALMLDTCSWFVAKHAPRAPRLPSGGGGSAFPDPMPKLIWQPCVAMGPVDGGGASALCIRRSPSLRVAFVQKILSRPAKCPALDHGHLWQASCWASTIVKQQPYEGGHGRGGTIAVDVKEDGVNTSGRSEQSLRLRQRVELREAHVA